MSRTRSLETINELYVEEGLAEEQRLLDTLGQKLNIGHMAGIGLKLRNLVVKSMLISDMIFLKSLNGLILIYGQIKFFFRCFTRYSLFIY